MRNAAHRVAVAGDLDLGALQRGERPAVAEALRLLLPRVRAWLQRMLGPGHDIDDATQDALIELAKSLPTFRGDSKLTTFAHRVVVRVAYRRFRQPARTLELVSPPVDELDPESRAMGREALRRVHACLARMKDKPRVAFVLCCVEGLTPSEAAEIEGVSAVTMRSRLMNARAEVSRRLDHDPYVVALTKKGAR